MFLLDDILVKPLLFVFKKIHEAAKEEIDNEAQVITAMLTDLYMRLETGAITESEFDDEEKQLLDRLDEIEERNEVSDDDEDTMSQNTMDEK